ncbi:hypothetical protein ES704_02510 [subsurface metagenome]
MRLVIGKITLWNFLSAVVYRIVLDLSFYFVISKVWNYAKFEFHLSIIKLIESYFLLFMVFALMPKSSKKLSTIAIWLLILLSYVPMLTLFALMDESRIFIYAVTGFWIAVFILLRIPKVSFATLKQAKIIRLSIFFSLSVVVFLMIYKYLGLSFNLDLTKVYDIRSHYVTLKIPFAGYLFNWVAYIVGPIFFALFVVKRKWIFTVLVLALQILLFSVTGMKTFLFVLPFVLTLMWVITRKNPLAWMAIGLVGVILLGMGTYWLIDDIWISSLFTRRVLLLPARLSFFYYDFFSEHGPIFLSTTRIFRSFLDYPYDLSPPHLIGQVYFNQPEASANTGIIGDAYMNFGFMGLFLWGILLAAILKLIDSSSKGTDFRIGAAAIAMPVIFLTNSALSTCLLTHGLLLALILLYLLPKEKVTNLQL